MTISMSQKQRPRRCTHTRIRSCAHTKRSQSRSTDGSKCVSVQLGATHAPQLQSSDRTANRHIKHRHNGNRINCYCCTFTQILLQFDQKPSNIFIQHGSNGKKTIVCIFNSIILIHFSHTCIDYCSIRLAFIPFNLSLPWLICVAFVLLL